MYQISPQQSCGRAYISTFSSEYDAIEAARTLSRECRVTVFVMRKIGEFAVDPIWIPVEKEKPSET